MMEQFYFVITERCNLTCSHCIRDSSPYRDETAETGMIKNALTQIAHSHPDSLVLLSGGEPTLHRHFRELLNFGLQLGLSIQRVDAEGAGTTCTSIRAGIAGRRRGDARRNSRP